MNSMTAEEILEHYDRGTLWTGGSGLDVADGYDRALTVRRLRMARGESPRGYKIGFTNRNIWPRYRIFAPVWGTVWNTTLRLCDGKAAISIAGCCQPRLEPEAVLGMRATPPANPSLDDLFSCVAWVAPGFELVQSHNPGWVFTAGDTAADNALHAGLLVGTRVPAGEVAGTAADFERRLAGTHVRLLRGDEVVEEGVGASILGGPLHALAHFVEALRASPGAADLQPGDVVSTGTWTDAWPVSAGQRWVAQFEAPLARLVASIE